MNRFDSAYPSQRQRKSGSSWLLAMLLSAIVAVGLLPSSVVRAQTLTVTGAPNPQCSGSSVTLTATEAGLPANSGYAAAGLPYVAPVAAGAANNVVLGDDQVSAQQLAAGQVFNFFGTPIDLGVNGFYIGSNGFITFRNDPLATQINPKNLAAPAVGESYNAIYLANTDLSPQAGGQIWWEVQNIGGGNVLVVTFDAVPMYNYQNPGVNDGDVVTVQALLYLQGHPNDGRIEIRVTLISDQDPGAPANQQEYSSGLANNCQPPAAVVGASQLNPGADVVNVEYSWDPAAPAITVTSVEFFQVGGGSLGVDATSPYNASVSSPTAATVNYYAVATLSNCTTVQSPNYAVTWIQSPTASLPVGNANVCSGTGNSYTFTQTVPGSTFQWSIPGLTAGVDYTITPNATSSPVTITFNPSAASIGGTPQTIRVVETGPGVPACVGPNNDLPVNVYLTPSGPITGGTTPICAPATGTNVTAPFTAPAGTGYAWSFNPALPASVAPYVLINTPNASSTTVSLTSGFTQAASLAPVSATLQVVVTTGAGVTCTHTTTTSITFNPAPITRTITSVPTSICPNQNITFSLSGGATANVIAWSFSGVPGSIIGSAGGPGQTNVVINFTAAGTATVNALETTPAGCARTNTQTFTVNPLPTPTVPVATPVCQYVAPAAGNPSYQTNPNPLQYVYTVSGAPADGYRWQVTNGTIVAVNGVAGVYANPYPGAGTFTTGATQITVRWTAPGAATLTVWEQNVTTGCVGSNTYNLTVDPTPTAANMSLTGPGIAAANPCANSTGNVYTFNTAAADNSSFTITGGTITAAPDPGGVVTGGGTGATYTAVATGTLQVTWGAGTSGSISHEYSNAGGCSAIEVYTITISPLPSFLVSGPTAACGTSSIAFSVAGLTNGGVPTYAWSLTANPGGLATMVGAGNGPSESFNLTNPVTATSGPYTVQLQVTNTVTGCSNTNTANFTIVRTPAAPVIGGTGTDRCDADVVPAGTYTITAEAGMAWTVTVTNGLFNGTSATATGTGTGAAQSLPSVTWTNNTPAPIVGSFSATQSNTFGTTTCTSPAGTANETINPRPMAVGTTPSGTPYVDYNPPAPFCQTQTPMPTITINNAEAGIDYYWLASMDIDFGAGFGINVGPSNNVTVAGWNAGSVVYGIQAVNPITGCFRVSTFTITVNPAPNTTFTGNFGPVCPNGETAATYNPNIADEKYYVTSPIVVGSNYNWTVSNGFIVAYSDNGATVTNTMPLSSTSQITTWSGNYGAETAPFVVVRWTGPNPGKIKVTEIRQGGAGCSFTTPDFSVIINPSAIPTVYTLGFGASPTPATLPDMCAGDSPLVELSSSEAGYTYTLEISADGGLTWTPSTAAAQVGTGAVITNWGIPTADLPYTGSMGSITSYLVHTVVNPNGSCPGYLASNNITINVHPNPAIKTVTATTVVFCEGQPIPVDVASTDAWITYTLQRRSLPGGIFANTGVSAVGNGGTLTLVDNTSPAGSGPLTATPNYEYQVVATTTSLPTCAAVMNGNPQVTVFAPITPQVVTVTPAAVCWNNDATTLTVSNTQDGVEYEVFWGGGMTPFVPTKLQQITTPTGAINFAISQADILQIQATNPGAPVMVTLTVQGRLFVDGVTITRPIPVGGCEVTVGTTVLTINPEPTAAITAPTSPICGGAVENYTPVGASAAYTYEWSISNAPLGTTPTMALPAGPGTVDPFTVTWGPNDLACNGVNSPITATIQMVQVDVVTGCDDTTTVDVVINSAVHDGDIEGDATACIYGGYEQHVEDYDVYRTTCGTGTNTTWPAGTTFLWTMPTNPIGPTGVIRSGQGTRHIAAEWNTTAGTSIAPVTVLVTLPWGCATTVTKNVTVYSLPTPNVTGPATVCQNQMGVIYTSTLIAGDNYLWEVVGGTIVGGTGAGTNASPSVLAGLGLNTITIDWLDMPNPTATIKLTETSVQGCIAVNTYTVNVTPTPTPVVTGPTTACDNTNIVLSTQNNAPNSVYTWNITGITDLTGVSIVSGGSTASATFNTGTVTLPATFGTFTVEVTETFTVTNCSKTSAAFTVTVYTKPAPVITRVTPGGVLGAACVGQTVDYSTPNVAGNSYNWTVVGGAITAGQGTNQITVNWNTVGSGSVTVAEWVTSTQCTTTVSQPVTVVNPPAPVISGPVTVCGETTATYSTPMVAGNTYLWTVTGGTLTTPNNTNTIGVQFTSPASGSATATIDVTETNTLSGCTGMASITVTVYRQPVVSTIVRTDAGNANQACVGTSIEYTSGATVAGSTYTWTVTGGTITAGQGTTTVMVQWTAIGNQTLTLVEETTGSPMCSATSTLNISVEDQPAPAITGPITGCTDNTDTYSVAAVAGHTYNWSIAPGVNNTDWQITTGTTSATMSVKWLIAGTYTITLTEANATGNCTATTTETVTVSATPNPVIARIAPAGALGQACEGQTITYNTGTTGNTYVWTVVGGTIVTGQGTNQIDILWLTAGNGSITVTETTTGSTCSRTVTQNVNVTPQPTPVITGPTVSCINKIHTYSTPAIPGNTYAWTITPGVGSVTPVFAPIAGYPNSNSITLQWIQTGLHNVAVTETSIAGCSKTVSIDVQVNPIPTPVITSTTGFGSPTTQRPGLVCENSTHVYTTAATPANVYFWTVTGGSIVSGQNTNTITVLWAGPGAGTVSVTETVPGSDCITTVTEDIDKRPKPTPVITGAVDPCENSTQVYTTPMVAGNTYTWTVSGPAGTVWSPIAPNQISVTWGAAGAGSVSVEEFVAGTLPAVPDPAACATSTTLNVTVRPLPPVPTITGTTTVCATDHTDVPPTINQYTYTSSNPGSVSFNWTVTGGIIVSGQGTSTVVVEWANGNNAPTTGTITVQHTTIPWGCTTQTTQVITINPLPNPTISGPLSVCQNSIQTYSTPGIPGNSYNWTVSGGNIIRAGQTTPNVTVEWTLPGAATLWVTETNTYGCTAINQIDVMVNSLPNVTVTPSGPTTFCQGGDVTLSAPLGFSSYVWSTGETSRNIVARTTGDYWVVVTDGNGCSNSSDTVRVNVFPSSLPIIALSGPTSFCEGGSVVLTAPNGFSAYRWSTGETTQSITVTTSGSYTVTVADGNACTGTSTEVDVTVYPTPHPVLAVIGTTTVCSGDSVEVRAPAGYSQYTWISAANQNYGTGRTIFVKQADTVKVQVVDANGCMGESDAIVINLSTVVTPVISANGPTTFCEGNAVTLTAPEGYANYIWSNGATSRSITVLDGGQYTVMVSDNMLCMAASVATTVTVNPLPARPTITRVGDTLKAVSAVAESYIWKRNDDVIPYATQSFYVVNQPGAYTVSIADNNTCSASSQPFDVILTNVDDDVVAGRTAELHLFPNPTNGLFTIETEVTQAGPVRIELVNAVGELVMTLNEQTAGGNFRTTVTMGDLASGVYNVVVTTGNQRWTVRLVRQ